MATERYNFKLPYPLELFVTTNADQSRFSFQIEFGDLIWEPKEEPINWATEEEARVAGQAAIQEVLHTFSTLGLEMAEERIFSNPKYEPNLASIDPESPHIH